MIFGYSIKEIVAAAGGLVGVVGGAIWLVKWAIWKFKKTPSEAKQEIQVEVDDAEEYARKSGRPKP